MWVEVQFINQLVEFIVELSLVQISNIVNCSKCMLCYKICASTILYSGLEVMCCHDYQVKDGFMCKYMHWWVYNDALILYIHRFVGGGTHIQHCCSHKVSPMVYVNIDLLK